MEYYKKQKFDLYNFEAYGGAIATLEKIKAMGAIYQAEEYLEEIFHDREYVTDQDINGVLWFDMDKFITDREPAAKDMLEYFIFIVGRGSTLYGVKTGDRIALIDEDPGYRVNRLFIKYSDLKASDVWAKNNRLYIYNRYFGQVDQYEYKNNQLLLVKNSH